MAGTAETTQVQSRAAMASKIIFSKKSIQRILDSDIWKTIVGENLSPELIEKMSRQIQSSTDISNAGSNLIEISYTNKDPMVAYETTKIMTDIFIEESIAAKQHESQAAYNFIDNQVKTYQQKLKDSEDRIKEFRSKNIDASESAKTNASQRLIELKRELETVDLDISTAESSLDTYKKQLRGESSFQDQASINRENQLNERILALETRLADLKLNYHDTYPDIVQLKGQIQDLKDQIYQELQKRKEQKESKVIQVPTGETAQAIQSQILATENRIASLQTRKDQLLKLMDRERATLDRINDVEAEIAELTRDYDVNREIYQNLLEQRENARISMNIDLENQGLTLKIQEPASIPVSPQGLRFSHILIGGLLLSIAIPIAIVFGLTIVDAKVRTEARIQDTFEIPILASVYTLDSPEAKKKNLIKSSFFVISLIIMWSLYSIAAYLRIKG
jgi:polysaccharide chain length determinant protein (PEP-CTERM system associated)